MSVMMLQPPGESQQLRERGGMDGASPELRWVATGPAEASDQLHLGTVTGACDRDMGLPDEPPGQECSHSLPACVPSPCWVLGMRYGPGVAFGTNSEGTAASVPRTCIYYKGRITQTTLGFSSKGSGVM